MKFKLGGQGSPDAKIYRSELAPPKSSSQLSTADRELFFIIAA